MAIACFCGLPASISVLILLETVALADPVFSGMLLFVPVLGVLREHGALPDRRIAGPLSFLDLSFGDLFIARRMRIGVKLAFVLGFDMDA